VAPHLRFPPTLAEYVVTAIKKGSHVLVEGELVSSTYERPNGKSKKSATTKITSWSIRADIVRKLDRGEPSRKQQLPAPILRVKRPNQRTRLPSRGSTINWASALLRGPIFCFRASVHRLRRIDLHKRFPAKLNGRSVPRASEHSKTDQQRFQCGDTIIECSQLGIAQGDFLAHAQQVALAFQQSSRCRLLGR